MKQRLSLPALAAAATLGCIASANATVYIGLQTGVPINTVASGSSTVATGPVVSSGSLGNFESIVVTGFGQPGIVAPQILASTVMVSNLSGAASAGTIKIYVTVTGITDPLGLVPFQSDFTTVDQLGWTETLRTYIDPSNGIYALTTLLGSANFNATNHDVDFITANTGVGPAYSATTVYTITATTRGTITADAAIIDAPEPASLALLGAALAGFGVIARRRRIAI
jgi:hypothetical protein